ncbi:CRM-domain containing factor CFM3, chloroplastic/mitochondrial [Nymphaea colorata]|nr:CRM-domain containing factor CFM3, chloroplastic/mitochondrial [Nymphaea colorata]
MTSFLSSSILTDIRLHHPYSSPPYSSCKILPLRALLLNLNSRPSLFFSSSSSSSSSFKNSAPVTDPNSGRPSTSSTNYSKSTREPSSPWLSRWGPGAGLGPTTVEPTKGTGDAGNGRQFDVQHQPRSPIERIVERLRNLGLSDDEEEEDDDLLPWEEKDGDLGEKELGYLLQRKWERPDRTGDHAASSEPLLPWERDEEGRGEVTDLKKRERRVKAPTLAELTLPDEELKRLRKLGMLLRERITIPKAGVTQVVLEKIHDKWRKSELVRLKFHETLAHDMKTAHEIVERRTGGLVIWRSGSVMVVYRGSNYERPLKPPNFGEESVSKEVLHEGDKLFVPDVISTEKMISDNGTDSDTAVIEKSKPSNTSIQHVENLTAEEMEYNSILDELGPRFVEWWGTGVLPVDADLLPPLIPGYKTPFRLLPTGMRSRLTNAELTNLRKLARRLPCHFALGRNRNHQGLATAIMKLWEKSTVVKIAVKRGIQNTNNKLMAEELKKLTGGILLLRNKYYIVIYRGKDFLPSSVASALMARQELTKDIQANEEKARSGPIESIEVKPESQAGTLAEFQEVQARWGREIAAQEKEKMMEEASRAKNARFIRRIEHKLFLVQAKKLRAERQLSKIEVSMVPVGPSDDQETITDEERFMFRRVGLRMKAYLPLGIRGVFDGVIENMHLHWKHRELVKLISKQKTLSFVEDTARLLEYESGGILVAIERVPKGYALIYYRGKNYRRPSTLRPRNLLTKAKALKRSVEMQRHEALCQRIQELENTIRQMKVELGECSDTEDKNVCNSDEEDEDYDSSYSDYDSEEDGES